MRNVNTNYIAGDWVDGNDTNENLNPSDLEDVIGAYARALAVRARTTIAAERATFPA